jgi:hypothetical protein
MKHIKLFENFTGNEGLLKSIKGLGLNDQDATKRYDEFIKYFDALLDPKNRKMKQGGGDVYQNQKIQWYLVDSTSSDPNEIPRLGYLTSNNEYYFSDIILKWIQTNIKSGINGEQATPLIVSYFKEKEIDEKVADEVQQFQKISTVHADSFKKEVK